MKKITCLDINGKAWEADIGEISFRPAVYGMVIQDGKVLLSPKWDGYDFPGGGLELGETIEQALIREVKEETGLDVKMGKIVACESSFFKLPGSGKYVNSILMYFLCTVVGGGISIEGFDEEEKKYAKKAVWVDLNKIQDIKFYDSVDNRKILKRASEME